MDVGANIGEITMVAARRVGAEGKVFAFEPMTSVYQHLLEHIERNSFDQVAAVKAGFAAEARRAQIFSAAGKFYDGSRNAGLGTLYHSSSRSVPAEEIELKTLDEFSRQHDLTQLDLIKIDVEGAELPVLKGGIATISRFHPYLIIEIQDQTASEAGYQAADILEWLERVGYSFFKIARKGRLKEISAETLGGFQNVFCVPPGSVTDGY
jgi:FkbM family methyltransferase